MSLGTPVHVRVSIQMGGVMSLMTLVFQVEESHDLVNLV